MHVLLRGSLRQRLSLASGLILFVFAATHFLNHAVGLIHIETMHDVQALRLAVTRSTVGTIVLASALLIHMAAGLIKVASRVTWRLPRWELAQIVLGLLIPFLLFPHIVNTRVAHVYFGVQDTYLYELARLWPDSAIIQSTLLLLVWVHGCIGIHFWLRTYDPYRTIMPGLLLLAVVIPAASLAGFMVSGRAVAELIQDPQMAARVRELTAWPSPADGEVLAFYRNSVRVGFAALLLAVAAVIGFLTFARLSKPKLTITYAGGRTVRAPHGATLLEISRMHRIPHAAVCGGRARCSTCRVRIDQGVETLPPPDFAEAVTLGSIGAAQNIRLACQIKPEHALTVTRLVRPSATDEQAIDILDDESEGVEKPLAILFLDMRGFTQISQNRLPYDIVFILNEFFTATGAAIAAQNGWIDKFLGDGLLAIFGRQDGVEAGCRQALRAARAIDLALDHINAKLEAEIGQPLKVSMGIHAGPTLMGRIGYGSAAGLTVIGKPVNVASRLEALAKERDLQMVLSAAVAEYARWSHPQGFTTTVTVRGVTEPIEVIGLARGRDLPASILAYTSDEEEWAAARAGA